MNMLMYFNVKSVLIEILIINAICSAILVIISKNPVISVIFLISLVLNSALFLVVKGMPFLGISYILIYLGAIIVLFLFVIMMINVRLTDILETGTQYTKNIPLALTVSGLFLYEFFNVLPAFLNSPILSLDDSVLINMGKEIVLTLNSFFVNGLSALGAKQEAGLYSLLEANSSILNGDGFNFAIQAVPLISNINWPETLINSYTQIVSVAYSLYTYGAFWFLLLGMILLLAMIAPIYISKR
jgi:NADH-ubiquinone oxidoreductase chain 6